MSIIMMANNNNNNNNNGNQYEVGNDDDDDRRFPHRKAARRWAVRQLRTARGFTTMMIVYLLFRIFPMGKTTKTGSQGGVIMFVVVEALLGIMATPIFIGANNLQKATVVGSDPSVALRQAKVWKTCFQISCATAFILPAALAVTTIPKEGFRFSVKVLLIVGSLVAWLFCFASRKTRRYIAELEQEDLVKSGPSPV